MYLEGRALKLGLRSLIKEAPGRPHLCSSGQVDYCIENPLSVNQKVGPRQTLNFLVP